MSELFLPAEKPCRSFHYLIFLNQILSSSLRPISSNNSKAGELIFYHLEYEPCLICSLKDTKMGPIKKA